MRVRRRHRWRKILVWGMVVMLASLTGGLWFAYIYATDSETLARLIRQAAPKYLPGARVDVLSVKPKLLKGEIHLNQVSVSQPLDGAPFQVLRIHWVSIRQDPKRLLEGRFEPTEVVVSFPTLRLRRRADGTCNLQGLLASPWPGPAMKTPPIHIHNATVELSDETQPRTTGTAILRDVEIEIEPGQGKGKVKFEARAKGDAFDHLSLKGVLDTNTGAIEFSGDVARLIVTETLRNRLPLGIRALIDRAGLTSGEIDVRVNSMAFNTKTPGGAIRYDISGRLRGAALNGEGLPFPINDLSAGFTARDGVLTIERAEGYYGPTTVRIEQGTFTLGAPETTPFHLALEILDLKLDEKLHAWMPRTYDKFWNGFQPSGRVSVLIDASRDVPGGPLRKKVEVECHDVAMLYEFFRYPVDHISGRLIWEGERIVVENMRTLIGGKPLVANGTIDQPGERAVVRLDFVGQGLPVDSALLNALPPDVREVVLQFSPTGAVSGSGRVIRLPPDKPAEGKRGKVAVHAWLDLNERCGIKWKGLPYPVNNLTGRLEIHPDLWEFKNMRGVNGQAEITGSGRVEKVNAATVGPRYKVALQLQACKLPFDDQLREALPPAWQKSWAILNPNGSSDVRAFINVEPSKPDSYVLEVIPRPATGVTLQYSREPKPGVDAGGVFNLPMEHVTGRFVFRNGPVDMENVAFTFYNAPVRFGTGRVIVENSGRFQLGVKDVHVRDIRLDDSLRRIMPPVMQQFAQRFDDGRTFTLKGNLGLGWSGVVGESVRCDWNDALVVFNDNSIQIQPGFDLAHMQGELNSLRGRADGDSFEAHGVLKLDSVGLRGQQITALESPLDVEKGEARLDSLKGRLLGGDFSGAFRVTLAANPKYSASLEVRGADLEQYAKTLPGRQSFRGLIDGKIALSGFGADVRTLQGRGEAHLSHGDLGKLPPLLPLLKLLSRSPVTRTAFDAADVAVKIENGRTYFEPIRLLGDALSLQGRGTMDVQGDLDLKLRVLVGRDRLRFPGLNLLREASGQFLVVTVKGVPSFPKFDLVPVPEVGDVFKKSLGQRRDEQDERISR